MHVSMVTLALWSALSSFSTGINVNQSYYSQSWQGGDAGAISWTAYLDLGIKKDISRNVVLTSALSLAFGQTYSQDPETGKWHPPVKSSDKIEDEVVVKLVKGWPVDPFVSARVLTQFYDRDDTLFLNPATFFQSLGAARRLYSSGDSTSVDMRIGVSFKEMMDRADTARMPVDGGIELASFVNWKLSDNITYHGKLRIFKALYSFNPPDNDDWKAPDVNLENSMEISVTKLIRIKIYAQWFYDREQTNRVQFRENLALSIGYSI